MKVVFATETLSLGINMPAKTVVIESLYKFSGESHAFLTSTEYTQFTGRAGRRGIDKVGNSVTLYNPMVQFSQVQKLAEMESLPIRSSFTPSYNMAVNLLRHHAMEDAVHLLNSSFAQFHADRDVVRLERSRARMSKRMRGQEKKVVCERGKAWEYFVLRNEVSRMEKEVAEERRRRRKELVNRELGELVEGDVIVLHRKGSRRPAVVLGISEDKHGNPRVSTMDDRAHFLKVSYGQFPLPPQAIGHLGASFLPADTRAKEKKLRQALAAFSIPPSAEWEGEHTLPYRTKLAASREKMTGKACNGCKNREQCMDACRQMRNLKEEIARIEGQMKARSDVSSRRLSDIMKVLARLDYLEEGRPNRKGLILSRVYNECDLLVVECLEAGLLHPLDAAETAAFASIFVFESRERPASRRGGGRERWRQKKPAVPSLPTPALEEAVAQARSIEGRVKSAEAKERLDLLRQLDAGFVRVVHEWASGEGLEFMASNYPQYSAGDFVRSMKQVLDILRQIKEAAEDPLVSRKVSAAMDLVNRSIVAYTSVVDALEEELV